MHQKLVTFTSEVSVRFFLSNRVMVCCSCEKCKCSPRICQENVSDRDGENLLPLYKATVSIWGVVSSFG